MLKRLHDMLLPCSGIAIFLVLWEATGRIAGDSFLAPPTHVLATYVQLLREGDMLRELATSLRQMLVGYLLALVCGVTMGVMMGRSRIADAMLRPWVSMFVVTSTAALVPILIVLLGTGLALRSTVVFLASVWYITLTIYNGAKGISPQQIATARSFSAKRLQIFWKVVLPSLFPYLITAARIGLTHAIRAMVMAEMFVIVGYGGLIHQTGLMLDTSALLALLLTLTILSLLANGLLRALGHKLAPWYARERTA